MTSSFVATIEGVETEHFEDAYSFSEKYTYDSIARNAVSKSGLRCARNETKGVKVRISKLSLMNGQVQRHEIYSTNVQLPYEPLTQVDYDIEMEELLSVLPEEFRGFVKSFAYDRGHGSGYEEIVDIAQSVVDGLLPCVENYKNKRSNV